MSIRTVGVVGTGVIGSSWIGLFLAHGLNVLVSDPAPEAEEKLTAYLNDIWPTLESLGLESNANLSNYKFIGKSLEGYYDQVDFVQENAPERQDLKDNLLGELDARLRPDVVIASSSSGIPSSQFITKCNVNPGRVLIGHPFNPPHLIPLVEVVPHPKTSTASIDAAISFYKTLDRKPVLLHQETPGFVANRLQAALCNEAYSLVSRGVVSAEDLDTCVTASLGPRWAVIGPFMANAKGGGGGIDGFKHLMEHLGPASQKWLADMKAHVFVWDLDQSNALIRSVGQELTGKDVAALERQHDVLLVEILRLKKSSTQGVRSAI